MMPTSEAITRIEGWLKGERDENDGKEAARVLAQFARHFNNNGTLDGISVRAELLREAEMLVCGERNASYGEPTQDFSRIARMWTIYLENKLKEGENITMVAVADMMIMLKLSRSVHSPFKRDTHVDKAGYAACALECAIKEEKELNDK